MEYLNHFFVGHFVFFFTGIIKDESDLELVIPLEDKLFSFTIIHNFFINFNYLKLARKLLLCCLVMEFACQVYINFLTAVLINSSLTTSSINFLHYHLIC